MTQVLNALGAGVEEHADHLVLRGRERLAGASPSPATTTTVSP
ncbi:hypothetical protein M5E87_03725 [Flavonifractor plautii]|nr:hypothetical protein M5E87_03725 [Flavonifractor plautii]